MTGKGTKRVALLADSEAELRHPMFHRLLKRSGFQLDDVYTGVAGEVNSIAELKRLGVRAIGLLGENALTRGAGQHDIARWRGRTLLHEHLPGVFIVPMLQPSRLMARRGGDDEELPLLMRHPPRFHGVWIHDLHYAVKIAEKGFQRADVSYLLDPRP